MNTTADKLKRIIENNLKLQGDKDDLVNTEELNNAINRIKTVTGNPVTMTDITTTENAKVVVTKNGNPASGVEVVLSNGKEDSFVFDSGTMSYDSIEHKPSVVFYDLDDNIIEYERGLDTDTYILKRWAYRIGLDDGSFSTPLFDVPVLNMGHTYRVDVSYSYNEEEDEYGNIYGRTWTVYNIKIHEIVSEQHVVVTNENGEIDTSHLITPTCVCSVANGDPTYSITATYSTAIIAKGSGTNSLVQVGCEAICDNNIAVGEETVAGILGFKVYGVDIDSDSSTIAVLHVNDPYSQLSLYSVGDIVNLDLSKHWYNRFKIRAIKYTAGTIVIEAIYPDLCPVNKDNLSLGDGDTDNWVWVYGKGVGTPIDQYVGTFTCGIKTFAAGYGAFAAGRQTKAIGNYSTALGRGTTADYASVAMGLNTHALGQESFTMGSNTKALGQCSAAFGGNTVASGKFSFAAGTGSRANGAYSAAFGNQTIASGSNQMVVGLFNEPMEYSALFIVGDGSGDDARSNAFVVYANGTALLGKNWVATQSYVESRISSTRSYTDTKCNAITNTMNNNFSSFALQCDTQIGSIYQIGGSSTSPNKNTASVAGAIALGTGNTASGQYAVVLGENSTASGKYAFSAGTGNTASGADSVTLGMGSTASMQHTLAQGWKSNATQPCAVAINCATTAEGENSFTQGQRTKTTGKCAAAFNYYTQANAANSSAFGNQTISGYENQLVAGKYNNNKSDTLLEVGMGTSSVRANCFETGKDKDGNAFITVGSTRITEAQLKKLLELI